ncbi:MAG: hypothetical protein KIC80_08495 [Brachyspira sp.]|nr:hypothetical protein [Brachyspira sp.]
MKISACSAYGLSYRRMPVFSSDNKQVPQKNECELKKEQLVKASVFAAGALALLGTGIYIWKHKRTPNSLPVSKNPADISTPLPDEPLANSLPEFIKQKLSVNNNFNKFKKFLSEPDKKSEIGSGANSVVYDMPFLKGYVLKVLNPEKNTEPNKIPLGIFPENVNLGQPVWIHPDNYKLIILKKVSGEAHSVADWSKVIYDPALKAPHQITAKQAKEYYAKIMKISQMEQSVFDDFASQLKVLDTTPKFDGEKEMIGFKTDCINPNNLLVDFKNNKLNIIDYFGKCKPEHQNSYMDMVAVISDFTLLPEYYDLMKPNQQKQFLKALKTIDEKCFNGAEKVGLTTDKNVFTTFINNTNKYFPIQGVKKADGSGEYVRQYDSTAKHLLDLLETLK